MSHSVAGYQEPGQPVSLIIREDLNIRHLDRTDSRTMEAQRLYVLPVAVVAITAPFWERLVVGTSVGSASEVTAAEVVGRNNVETSNTKNNTRSDVAVASIGVVTID